MLNLRLATRSHVGLGPFDVHLQSVPIVLVNLDRPLKHNWQDDPSPFDVNCLHDNLPLLAIENCVHLVFAFALLLWAVNAEAIEV